MLLAAMLAMVLVAAAPALAQAVIEGDEAVDNSQTQYVDCTQVQAAAADQYSGDANAAGDDESIAVADIANELGISQEAVQNCVAAGEDANVAGVTGGADGGGVVEEAAVDGVDDDGDGVVDDVGVAGVDDDADGVVDEIAEGEEVVAAGGAVAGTNVLPDTGGASLFTLGAGALLVGGGLLARRIFS